MKKVLIMMLLVVFTVSSLAGCGGKGNPASSDAGKKITYTINDEPEQMDPTMNQYARSSIVLQNLFRGLYKVGEDGNTAPALAESYTLDSSGTVYTFTLRENAKWSDGQKVTAQDFEYSWKRVLDPAVGSPTAMSLYSLKNGQAFNEGKARAEDVGVKALDERMLEVTLESPTPWFIELTGTTAFFPVRKDILEAHPDKWTQSPSTYACTGPFMLSEIKPKEKLVLVKNPNYVDADKVKLDTLEIVFIEAPETALAAYNNNDIQITANLNSEAINQYKGTGEYHTSEKIGFYYFDFNTKKEPFTDARVRKAFALSIDREQILNKIVQGPGKPAYGFVPFGIPDPSDKNKDFRDSAGDIIKEDVAKAKALLTEAGYPDGQGMPEVVLTVMANQSNKDIAQAFQNMWKENLGVDVQIQTFESKVYWDELANGNFSIARDGWTGDYPDPLSTLEIFTSKENEDDNQWANAEFDALINANRIEQDPKTRYENFLKIEQILAEEMPIFPLYHYENAYIWKPNVKGVIVNYIGHTIFEYATIE